nr:hypothetical protein CFP56_21988 [Quercus suber]
MNTQDLLRASDSFQLRHLPRDVEHPDLHHLPDDPGLDLSRLSPAPGRTHRRQDLPASRWHQGVGCHRRRLRPPGHGLHGQLDDLRRISLSSDDAEAAARKPAARALYQRRPQRFHHLESHQHGHQPATGGACRLYGRRQR